MSKPAVSVVIPVHNRLRLLGEALDSVAAQTFRDYEVIVVDDGSDEPIAQVAGHPVKPRVLRQHCQGPGAARNRGVADAHADLVAFLDSDDLWLPAKLERFVSALASHPDVAIFYGPMLPIDEAGRPVEGRSKTRHEGRITRKLFASCFVDVPTVVCRKAALEKAGGFDARLPVCEDYDLWLRMSLTEPFGYIAEPLAKRRLHDNRLSKSRMSRNFAVRAQVLRGFYDAHRSEGVLDESEARARLARVCFVAGRAAYHNGEYQHAIELCKAAREYGSASIRTLFISAAAGTMAMLGRENGHREKALPAK
jgi:glycosyltransferase involved in cell wall biosynthesis